MPPLHRYFGTPVTTWILNVDLRAAASPTSTAACAASRSDALAAHGPAVAVVGVRVRDGPEVGAHAACGPTEVPVRFYKDREGRLSHHKRIGWFSPWHAAWINLRAMFVYGADFFLFRPGLVLLALGLLLTLPLSRAAADLGPITFSLHWMLLGDVALRARSPVRLHGHPVPGVLRLFGRSPTLGFRRFSYTRTVAASALMFVAGVGLAILLDRRLRTGGTGSVCPSDSPDEQPGVHGLAVHLIRGS